MFYYFIFDINSNMNSNKNNNIWFVICKNKTVLFVSKKGEREISNYVTSKY